MLGIIAISIHLCTLRSFGVPYLAPMAPLKGSELKGVLWRSPMWMMDTRPHLTGNLMYIVSLKDRHRVLKKAVTQSEKGRKMDNSSRKGSFSYLLLLCQSLY